MRNFINAAILFFCLSNFALGATSGQKISASAPLTLNSGVMAIPPGTNSTNGYLTSADHTTFVNKQNALTIGNLTSSTAGLSVGGGTGSIIGSGVSLTIQTATGSQPGLLSAADWTAFNAKQSAGNYLTALTGNVVASGPGSSVATIQPNVVSNSMLAQSPSLTLKGNNTGSAANASDLTVAQVIAMLQMPELAKGSLGSTPVFNFLSGATPSQSGTLSANATASFSNGISGGHYTIRLRQASSGGPYTLSFPGVLWPGGIAYQSSTLASAIDIIEFYYDGTNWYGTFEQNFQ